MFMSIQYRVLQWPLRRAVKWLAHCPCLCRWLHLFFGVYSPERERERDCVSVIGDGNEKRDRKGASATCVIGDGSSSEVVFRREGASPQRGREGQGERLHPENGEGEDGEAEEEGGEREGGDGEGRGREEET